MQDIVVKFEVPFMVKRADWDGRSLIEGWDSTRMHCYLDALQREVAANADEFGDCRVTAVRWGGGLASLANAQEVSDTMRLVRDRYNVAKGAPVSMEAAISNISGASMPFFRRAGITRFDFEMMSLFPKGFALVNKLDNLGDLPVVCDYFLHAVDRNNLGLVLLSGYEATDRDNFRRSVVEVLRTPAVHVRLMRASGEQVLSPEETAAQEKAAREILCEGGFIEYLPNTFAKPGFEDPVLKTETTGCEGLIGFGLGAVTRLDGVASTNTSDLERYCAGAGNFAAITESAVPLSTQAI